MVRCSLNQNFEHDQVPRMCRIFHFLTKSGFLKIKFTPEPVPAKLAPTGGRGIYKDLSFEVTRTRRAHLEADSREESAIGSFY